MPQPPQFERLVVTSTHVTPHWVSPGPEHTHAPAEQKVPAGQEVLHWPQWMGDV